MLSKGKFFSSMLLSLAFMGSPQILARAQPPSEKIESKIDYVNKQLKDQGLETKIFGTKDSPRIVIAVGEDHDFKGAGNSDNYRRLISENLSLLAGSPVFLEAVYNLEDLKDPYQEYLLDCNKVRPMFDIKSIMANDPIVYYFSRANGLKVVGLEKKDLVLDAGKIRDIYGLYWLGYDRPFSNRVAERILSLKKDLSDPSLLDLGDFPLYGLSKEAKTLNGESFEKRRKVYENLEALADDFDFNKRNDYFTGVIDQNLPSFGTSLVIIGNAHLNKGHLFNHRTINTTLTDRLNKKGIDVIYIDGDTMYEDNSVSIFDVEKLPRRRK